MSSTGLMVPCQIRDPGGNISKKHPFLIGPPHILHILPAPEIPRSAVKKSPKYILVFFYATALTQSRIWKKVAGKPNADWPSGVI